MNTPCTPCGAASCHPPSFPPAADALNKDRSCQNGQNATHTAAINGMGAIANVITGLNSFSTFIFHREYVFTVFSTNLIPKLYFFLFFITSPHFFHILIFVKYTHTHQQTGPLLSRTVLKMLPPADSASFTERDSHFFCISASSISSETTSVGLRVSGL